MTSSTKAVWAIFVVAATVLGVAPSAIAADPKTYGSPIPFSVGAGKGITPLPSGEVWAIDFLDLERRYSLVKVGPNGAVRQRLSGVTAQRTKFTSITLGSDGNVWVAARRAPHRLKTTFYRIAPNGTAKRFVPRQSLVAYAMTPAPDGTIWFIDASNRSARVARLALDGRVSYLSTKFPYPLGSIAQGTDGNMWVEGRRNLFRFEGTKLKQRFNVEANTANSITPLPDGRVMVPARSQLQIISRAGVTLDPVRSSPAGSFPILSAFVTAQGKLAFTSGGPGGDDAGPTISGSGLSVLDGQGGSDYDAVFTRGINWVPNFDEALESSLSPGAATVAVDPSGNLWAGLDLRSGSGLAKFPALAPIVPTPGEALITRTQRNARSVRVKLSCAGGLHQFCVGRVAVAVANARRTTARKRFVMRTGTRTTLQIDLRDGESATESSVES